MSSSKQSVRSVVDALGRAEIATRVGVKRGSVTEAIKAGLFPASWYIALRDLGAGKGVTVPAFLFRWKMPNDSTTAVFEDEIAKCEDAA